MELRPKNFRGRSSRPLFYFALSALTFSFLLTSSRLSSWLPCYLFSLSIVQSSSQRSFVAIVECIESLKNDVKQKMVDASCSLSSRSRDKVGDEGECGRFVKRSREESRAHSFLDYLITPLFISLCAIIRKIPCRLSCHACAIIPGRRLLRRMAKVPNIAP